MALREEVLLSIQRAQQQIDQLQNQLAQLSTPLVVPVDVQGEEAVASLRQQLDAADEQVDVTVNTQGIQGAEAQFQDLAGEIDDTEDELRDAQIQADRLGDELDTTGTRGVQAFGGMRSALGPLAATLAAGIGLNEIIDQLGRAVSAASDLEQSIGGVQAIFGDASDEVLAFGETADQAVGLSANAFNELTAQLGAQLQAFGFSAADAGDEAIRLVELGADLAATFGGPVSDAVGAVGSLLRGEINPIERYGVAVNQAAITANALEEGLIGTSSEMDIQTRALSALDLLFEQTAGAQGQFGREADTTAGQLERQRAQMENVRAELGEALIPAVQAFLELTPDLIESVKEMGPVFATAAESAADFVSSLEPVISNLPQIIEGFGLLSDLGGLARAGVNQTAETLGSLVTLRFDDFVDNLGEARDIVVDLQDVSTRRVLSIAFLNSLEEGEDNAEAFAEGLRDLFDASEGVLDVETVQEYADAAGLADEEAARLVLSLLRQAQAAGADATQIRVLTDAFNSFFDAGERGEALNFDRAGRGAQDFAINLAATTEAVEGADRALLNLASGVDEAADAQLPVIVRNFEDLAIAAEEAGVDVVDFVNNLPDDITLDLSGPELEVLSLIETLDGLETRLSELNEGQFANIELPELEFDSTGAVTNLDEVIEAIVEQAGEDAQIEANLSEIIIGADAIDLAGFIRTLEPEVQSALAASFASEQQLAGEAQAALDGTMEGLAAGAAEQLAETLGTATPEQLAALGVFAEDNFVSQVVRNQLAGTAGEIADVLSQGIADSPNLVLDMTDAEISDLTSPAQTIAQRLSDLISSNIRLDPSLFSTEGTAGAPSGTTSDSGGSPNLSPVEVNINNATTEDVTTSATQAAQTIQAVSGSLSRVQ